MILEDFYKPPDSFKLFLKISIVYFPIPFSLAFENDYFSAI